MGIIVLTGTFGYTWIEGWSLFDGLYMTIITLTTVGYQEIHDMSQNGRIFTLILLLVGIGNFAYLVRNMSLQFLNPLFSGYFKDKRMHQKLENMKDHFIVCGFGRIGHDVVQHLIQAGKEVVVVDAQPSEEMDYAISGIPNIHGDASSEEILQESRIQYAKGLVCAVSSEAENVFIAMTAREMNPDLNIIARYEEDATRKKLMRAGANQVVNPYSIGSKKISQILLKPGVTRILDYVSSRDGLNMDIQEIIITKDHKLFGRSLAESEIKIKFNVIVLAVKHLDGTIHSAPKSSYVFAEEDMLLLIADEKEMEKLIAYYA